VSPRRRLLVLAVAGAVTVLVGALLVTWLARPSRPVPAQEVPGAVILVPGYGGNAGSLAALAEQIRATGRTARVVDLPDGGTGDLVRQAEAVDDAVSDALDAGAPSVDVIGYSAGGVVTRLWFQRHDGVHKARRIVTLGAPHHGTQLAAAGVAVGPGACPLACQQLATGSRLLSELDTPVPDPPAWLAVWTAQDQTVTPPDSGRLEGALSVSVQDLCPGRAVSHSQLPSDAVVTRLVLAAIGPSPLVIAKDLCR
jgi:pimeloyl-ACP methyl ester carboxylesterase